MHENDFGRIWFWWGKESKSETQNLWARTSLGGKRSSAGALKCMAAAAIVKGKCMKATWK